MDDSIRASTCDSADEPPATQPSERQVTQSTSSVPAATSGRQSGDEDTLSVPQVTEAANSDSICATEGFPPAPRSAGARRNRRSLGHL
ncbi:hypothetical protein JG687_00017103 [Phytophthora cactorum]|uniref:Uncharacterized protein n=1 Tax=Phytophthora cactorum TaxID=29920 RepID=A0A8T1TTB4_9STRA|nr:hypothetical protein JG687_00017103 [Phytophthora cactorum]